jgi:hypothetical protein
VLAVPPAAANDAADGDNDNVGAAATWDTPNEAITPPAVTTTLPDRAAPVVTAAVTANATPDVPDARDNDTQLGADDTDHDD